MRGILQCPSDSPDKGQIMQRAIPWYEAIIFKWIFKTTTTLFSKSHTNSPCCHFQLRAFGVWHWKTGEDNFIENVSMILTLYILNYFFFKNMMLFYHFWTMIRCSCGKLPQRPVIPMLMQCLLMARWHIGLWHHYPGHWCSFTGLGLLPDK